MQIYNNDCLNVLKDIPNDSIDLVFTDPPYNLKKSHNRGENHIKDIRSNYVIGTKWDELTKEEYYSLIDKVFKECSRIAHKGTSMFMFVGDVTIDRIRELGEQNGWYFKTSGVWHKTNPIPVNMNLHFLSSLEFWVYFTYKKKTGTFNNDGKPIHNFIETSVTPMSEKRHGKHPTQKPLSVTKELISILSNKGDTVLDPFMGTGTTGVACQLLGREFIGIEKESEYFEIAKNRLLEVEE